MSFMLKRFDSWFVTLDWLYQLYVLSLPLAGLALLFLGVFWRLERKHWRLRH